MKKNQTSYIVISIIFSGITLLGPWQGTAQVNVQLITDKLVSPVGMVEIPDGTGRFCILEQQGLAYLIKDGKLQDKPFLDIRTKLASLTPRYDERGLLGIAFHPKYAQNGQLYVYYSSYEKSKDIDHKAVLSMFKVDPKNPDKVLPYETVLLTIDQPEWNHNGGQILFGKDGYLYLGLGDGGSGGDPHGTIGNAQDLSNLLGKILRIDVDKGTPYSIPTDNPFINKKGARPEIYALGLRNPWRFSIDEVTGRMFCGDVGQNKYEEINIIEKGKNYGWRNMEGLHCFNPAAKCQNSEFVLPIAEYDRSEGSSVIGGYVYRGKQIKSWYGKYVFGDWRGKIFSLTEQTRSGTWKREEVFIQHANFQNLNINSFAVDSQGEIYIIVQDLNGPFQASGMVLKFVP